MTTNPTAPQDGAFQHPCGRRSVVSGKWGHMLAHPSDCPDCAAIRALQQKGPSNG